MESRDRFEGTVYFVKALDKFITIDYHATPAAEGLVMVERLGAGKIAVERYSGQSYIGVVRVLEFYELSQSEQGNPKPASTVPIDRANQAPIEAKLTSKPQKGSHMKSHLLPLLLVIAAACASSGAPSKLVDGSITPAEAKNHIGKHKTVCGIVASANFATRSKRQPTFLNLDKAYPDHIFIAVIWIENRYKFGTPETTLKGKRVCVTGLIEEYQGIPEIVLKDPSQLSEERN